MADIIPFRGTYYNPANIKDLSKAVAPPYDVISPEEQDMLYGSDPCNIVRILLGKDYPGDNDKENKYTRACRFLEDWQKKNILKKNEKESIYVYSQDFSIDGQKKKRTGFIALLKLEEFGQGADIYPHENTLSAPKEDRARLIQAIEANLGPVFVLFGDEGQHVESILEESMKPQPLIDIMDYQGINNRLWHISDKDTVKAIVRLMKDKKLFIADGHHRYEVGLNFSKLKKDPRYGYILTYFTNLYADGIVILPVHRLISGVGNGPAAEVLKDIEKTFTVRKIASKSDIKGFLSSAGHSERRFVLYMRHRIMGLSLEGKDLLDVDVLHDLIIEPLRKKAEARHEKISIDFTKDMDYAINEVDEERFSFSAILNPVSISQIRDRAFSGKRMSQKSTYFYPKILTGLVINVF